MSTKAIYVVTGRATLMEGEHYTCRLFRESDGYPSFALADIVRASKLALNYMIDDRYVTALESRRGRRPTLADMPAKTFAHFLMAAGLTWDGPKVYFDKCPNDPAEYQRPPVPEMFGRGGPHWAYLLDVSRRSVHVFRARLNGSDVYLKNGPSDPLTYADDCVDEAKARIEADIRVACDRLVMTGWTLNQPAIPKSLT